MTRYFSVAIRWMLALVIAVVLALPTVGEAIGSQKGSAKGGGEKTVHVKGYTKKDGTYVPPHDRKAPEKKNAATAPPPAPPASASTNAKRDKKGQIQRSEAAKHAFARQTGYPNGRPGYVIDHIVPLACGGKDEPSNMQWQSVADGKAKDKVERIGCK